MLCAGAVRARGGLVLKTSSTGPSSYAAEHCSQLKGEDTKYAWRGESVLCMRACLSHVLIKAPLAAYGIAYSMAATDDITVCHCPFRRAILACKSRRVVPSWRVECGGGDWWCRKTYGGQGPRIQRVTMPGSICHASTIGPS
eukprot:364522-Chlamydomonas_euryale.AAC.12